MKFYLGCDISEGKINFCLNDGTSISFEKEVVNSANELKQFIKDVISFCGDVAQDKEHTLLLAMEYTGIYNNLLLDVVKKQKVETVLIHANNIKTAFGQDRLKNDKIDARKIAEYTMRFEDKLQTWVPLSDNLQKIKHLMTERSALIKTKAEFSQRLKGPSKFYPKDTTKQITGILTPVIDEVEKAIKVIEEQILALVTSDSETRQTYNLLLTVPGIGPVTALTLIGYTANFTKFQNAKQLGCYCGVVPFEHSSGTYKGKSKVSQKANKEIKTLLHMCAVSISQTHCAFGEYYRRKVGEGKNNMSALNALRNKILKTAFACVKNKTPYQREYQYTLVA